jgi:hypothetical protein
MGKLNLTCIAPTSPGGRGGHGRAAGGIEAVLGVEPHAGEALDAAADVPGRAAVATVAPAAPAAAPAAAAPAVATRQRCLNRQAGTERARTRRRRPYTLYYIPPPGRCRILNVCVYTGLLRRHRSLPAARPLLNRRFVALQVEFERQILEPVFHLIGFRLWV